MTVAAVPLLETKFHIPQQRPGVSVARPRLDERLSRGSQSRLTLISAPAGFGKTTLLTDWLAAHATAIAPDGRSAAWLSLDERDNDPTVFWTYLVAALRSAAPQVGESALSLLQSPQQSIEAVLATLLNDLRTIVGELVLVLDDYHVIDTPEVHDDMVFLLEHLPPQVHLVIAGRADPALPLARLRARGELVEIRAADLRFTPDEAAAYLNGVMGLALTAADVGTLEGRTEGWIAALQLAALSMQGRDDVGAFIAGFAGDDRYIVDYLAEEVLLRQPEQVRRFLLQTSILDRLCGSLCNAVTGQGDSKVTLAELERENLFLVPLDDRRQWYRYHQLFADVLQAHLLDEQAALLPELHRRASSWYEQNDEPAEAIGHALLARDFDRAADLVELAIPDLRRRRQETLLRSWLEALPDEVFHVRPVLSAAFAGVLLAGGDIAGVDARLGDAERWLQTADAGAGSADEQMVVSDLEGFRLLAGSIEVYRAAVSLAQADVPGTEAHARRALELAPNDDHLGRAAAAGFLALTAWTTGDLEAAHEAWSDCMDGLERAGHVSDALGCAIALADIRLVQGRLGDAMRTYEHGLQRKPGPGESVPRGTADMHVGMSEVHRERNDLQAGTRDLLRSQELGDYAGLAQNRYRWRVAMARIRQAQGDPAGASDLLDEAERVYVSDYYPNVRPIPAMRARLQIAQGNLDEARDWASAQGLTSDDEVSYLREFKHITLARLLLAGYAVDGDGSLMEEATRLLGRLLLDAESGGRSASVIEILMLQARAHQLSGGITAALVPLQQALTLAEPEGFVRIFVDEGVPMEELLREAERRGIAPTYVRRLLTSTDSARVAPPVAESVIEPLSDREMDVLRLLATDLDGPAIARRLFVSVNTMRTHTKRIYTKLGVNSRRAAVRRAEELDLL